MAANGILDFQGTNQVNFMGAASNIVIDTVTASLGIGVDVNGPTSNLHVVGNAHVSTNLTIGGNIDFIGNLTQGGAPYGGSGGSSPWLPTTVNVPADGIYYTAGNVAVDTNTFFVDTVNDRVGIGTSNPQYRLDVGSGGGDVMLRVMNGLATTGKLLFGRTGTADNRSHAIEVRNNGDGDNNYMKFLVHDGGGVSPYEGRTDVMTLRGDGRVGIGTSTPGYKLDVTGDIRFTGDIYKGNVLQALNSPFLTNGVAPNRKAYYTDGPVGIANVSALTTQTLQIGANVTVNDTASDKLVVSGDVYIAQSLHAVDLVKTYEVKCNALFIKDVQVTNQVPEDGDLRGYTPGIS